MNAKAPTSPPTGDDRREVAPMPPPPPTARAAIQKVFQIDGQVPREYVIRDVATHQEAIDEFKHAVPDMAGYEVQRQADGSYIGNCIAIQKQRPLPRETVREVYEPTEETLIIIGKLEIRGSGGTGMGTTVFIDGVHQEKITEIDLRIRVNEAIRLTITRLVLE